MGKIRCRSLGSRCVKGGIFHSFRSSPSNFSCSSGISIISWKPGEVRGPEERSVGNAPEGGNRAGNKCRPGILQQTVPGQEGLRGMETSARCLQSESLCDKDEVFNGDSTIRPVFHSEGRLDGVSRYERCLFPRADTSELETFSSFCIRRPSFSVQCPVLRPEYGTSGVHQSPGSSSQNSSYGRSKDPFISGRLVNSGQIKGGDSEGKEVYFGSSPRTGHSDKSGKIAVRPHSDYNLSRDDSELCNFLGFTSLETNSKLLTNSQRILRLRQQACKGLAEAPRSYVISRKVHTGSKASNEIHSICPSTSVGQNNSIRQDSGSSSSVFVGRSDVVERRRETQQRNILGTEEPRAQVAIRRVPSRLGSYPESSAILGGLDRAGKSLAYQQPRVESNMERPEGGRDFSASKDSGSVCRQHYGSSLPAQSGGNQILGPLCLSQRHLALGRTTAGCLDSSIHQWPEKCDCRLSQQEESNPSHRMDSEPRGLSSSLEALGSASGGLIRDKVEPSPSFVHVPSPGQSSLSRRRHVAVMVQHGRLCLSPIRYAKEGHQQVQGVDQLQNDLGRAMVAPKRVVSGPSGVNSGRAKDSTSQTGSAFPTSGKTVPSKPPHSSSDRLETLVRFTRAKKFSPKVTRSIFTARGPSTNIVYQQRWATYVRWCRAHNLSAACPSVNSLCEFFIYLKEKKNFAVGTIRGYRSTLHSVLRHTGLQINVDPDISDVLRSLQLQTPRESRDVVPWNLDVVLRYLCSDVFEPIQSSTLVDLTKKTVFLITLALAKRVSEVQALSKSVGFSNEGAVVSLALGFRAKNDFKCKALPRNFLIKDLTSLVGIEEEAKLCPVRCLREYLRRTKGLRSNNVNRLFISPRNPSRQCSKNGISHFIKTLIKDAHSVLKPELLPILKVKAHEVRAVSTSVLFAHTLSLQSVMEAAQWRCNSVFASNYLKDVSIQYEECCTLGPFVAAGTVVS